ncbi:DUF1822 family protein [Scytonema sp. PRP1]|uniref:DUF1822 family protein n=1 Tax=Scytonema sp. PRP1 TaxID=3120513 RepID=UPI00300CF97E
MDLTFATTSEWWLELPPEVRAESWQQSRLNATLGSLWNTYLNLICLNAVLAAIQAEYDIQATVELGTAGLYALWEFVNGTAITVDGTRLVLIPTEAIDDGELEVPQEWVDIPSWVGDYYLAVQVNAEADWARVWGYTTHEQLKVNGSYDSRDRTYCMDASHLKKDLNAFWVTYQLCRGEQTRAEIVPLPELPVAQAENLIQRLGNPSVTFPRVAVPFTLWGALLEHEEWRQMLYQQRQGNVLLKIPVHLNQWFQQTFETAWQAVELLLGPNFVYRGIDTGQEAAVKRAKLIDLGIQFGSQAVVLLVAITPETEQRVSVRVQLHPSAGTTLLPRGVKLALLSSSKEISQEVQAREQDNYIQLKRFRGQAGEQFSIKIALNDAEIIEDFVI